MINSDFLKSTEWKKLKIKWKGMSKKFNIYFSFYEPEKWISYIKNKLNYTMNEFDIDWLKTIGGMSWLLSREKEDHGDILKIAEEKGFLSPDISKILNITYVDMVRHYLDMGNTSGNYTELMATVKNVRTRLEKKLSVIDDLSGKGYIPDSIIEEQKKHIPGYLEILKRADELDKDKTCEERIKEAKEKTILLLSEDPSLVEHIEISPNLPEATEIIIELMK